MKHFGICRLCTESHELKNSHIIPSWAFKFIRDKKLDNRFYELFNKNRTIIQDGPKEYLLCDECEQQIGQYEKYFKEAVHLNRHGTDEAYERGSLIINNLDYKKIKLFFLSLLWRASVSSKPEFENVSIGEDEEVIRRMIDAENPGFSGTLSVAAMVPLLNGRNEGWATTFLDITYEGRPAVYCILLAGIFYGISTAYSNTMFPQGLILNETGYWVMPMRDVSEAGCLWDLIRYHSNE